MWCMNLSPKLVCFQQAPWLFAGPPNPSKWSCELGDHGWGNGELQSYTDAPTNVWVSDGLLHIQAKRETHGQRHYTSARLTTKGKADWLYGRIEVRLRLPSGRGTWAAAWMLPTHNRFGDWPMCGEIDIMEHVGHDAGRIHGTIHTEMCNHKKGTQVGQILPVAIEEWHTYGVAWSYNRLSFFHDGHRYLTVTKADGFRMLCAQHLSTDMMVSCQENWASEEAWPFNKPFFILLQLGAALARYGAPCVCNVTLPRNLAVGGDWGGQKVARM